MNVPLLGIRQPLTIDAVAINSQTELVPVDISYDPKRLMTVNEARALIGFPPLKGFSEMPLDLLRTVIEHNRMLIEQLHDAHNKCDPDRLRELLDELDSNNADLNVALEELNACPPTPSEGRDDRGAGGTGPKR